MRLLRLHHINGKPVVINIFNVTHFYSIRLGPSNGTDEGTRIIFVDGAHIDVIEPFDTVDMASVKVGSQ